MNQKQPSRIFDALAVLAVAGLLAVAADAFQPIEPAPTAPQLIPTAKPHKFSIAREGEFITLRQEAYRIIHFRPQSLVSFVQYAPGEGLAAQYSYPIIVITIGAGDFRLDCVDQEQADLFTSFMVATKTATPAQPAN